MQPDQGLPYRERVMPELQTGTFRIVGRIVARDPALADTTVIMQRVCLRRLKRGTRFGGPPQKRGTSSNPGGCWFRLTKQENQTESSEEPTEVRRVGDTSAVPCC